jgi:hypothetical protein
LKYKISLQKKKKKKKKVDKNCLKRLDDFKKCFTDKAVINALDKCLLQNITEYQSFDCSLRVGNELKLSFSKSVI